MVKKSFPITFTKEVVQNILYFALIFLISIPELIAGGLSINEVWFNGYPPGSTFYTNQNILMSYTADEYSFSGINGTYEYYVFLLTKKLS